MEQPKVIFLDAVGTLFGVRGSVGEIYGDIARQMGVDIPAESLNRAFFESFKIANPLAFPGVDSAQIPELEFQWWREIARGTFARGGGWEKFADFNAFFQQLYDYFATEEAWYVYPDVFPALQTWKTQGIDLGIISNFDTRIYPVLERLELKEFFSSITISSLVGSAKPNEKIFAVALEKHNCISEQAWHIGDSIKEDYYGAKAVGMRAFLLER
jgi:putative hydrolase of the HAD superfamily